MRSCLAIDIRNWPHLNSPFYLVSLIACGIRDIVSDGIVSFFVTVDIGCDLYFVGNISIFVVIGCSTRISIVVSYREMHLCAAQQCNDGLYCICSRMTHNPSIRHITGCRKILFGSCSRIIRMGNDLSTGKSKIVKECLYLRTGINIVICTRFYSGIDLSKVVLCYPFHAGIGIIFDRGGIFTVLCILCYDLYGFLLMSKCCGSSSIYTATSSAASC
ncbi:hypothetical protein MNB_SV-10-126 [hydrothermal vent metagenome]|uniref:Uncharacterized protein n=1 Tax=hydrothermal vent metagenome TaxID=652676 RepID=A0A1W1BR38_9ZZZZ